MGDFIQPPPNMQPVAIYEDGGGLVSKYQAMAQQYRLEGRKIKIMGSCRSACVLALSVPTTCVAPGAVIKAHYAYELDTKIIRYDVTNRMMSDLPERIRNQLEPNLGRSYNSKTILNYKDLVSLGVPSCSDNHHVVAQTLADPIDLLLGYIRRK